MYEIQSTVKLPVNTGLLQVYELFLLLITSARSYYDSSCLLVSSCIGNEGIGLYRPIFVRSLTCVSIGPNIWKTVGDIDAWFQWTTKR